jgi:hypothetical protein
MTGNPIALVLRTMSIVAFATIMASLLPTLHRKDIHEIPR